jgi:hypothetical protein
VFAVAPDELAGYGKTEADTDPSNAPDDGTYTFIDKQGNTHTLPNGVGYGWDYAPGRSALESVSPIKGKLEGLLARDEAIARAYSEKLMTQGAFENWYAGVEREVAKHRNFVKEQTLILDSEEKAIREGFKLAGDSGNWPMAVLNEQNKAWLGTDANIVQYGTYTAFKQAYKRGNEFPASEYYRVQEMLDRPIAVLPQRENGNFLVFFKSEGLDYFQAVIKATKDASEVFFTSLHRVSPDRYQKYLKQAKSRLV